MGEESLERSEGKLLQPHVADYSPVRQDHQHPSSQAAAQDDPSQEEEEQNGNDENNSTSAQRSVECPKPNGECSLFHFYLVQEKAPNHVLIRSVLRELCPWLPWMFATTVNDRSLVQIDLEHLDIHAQCVVVGGAYARVRWPPSHLTETICGAIFNASSRLR